MPWEIAAVDAKAISTYHDQRIIQSVESDRLRGLLADGWEPFAATNDILFLRHLTPDLETTGKELQDTYAELRAI